MREQTRKAARDPALAEARAQASDDDAARLTDRSARRAAHRVLGRHDDAPWRTPANEIEHGDADADELIARLRVAAPQLLGQLLDEPAAARTVRERLSRLYDAALIARADIALASARPPCARSRRAGSSSCACARV